MGDEPAKIIAKMYGKYDKFYIKDSQIKPKIVEKVWYGKITKDFHQNKKTEMSLGGNMEHMIIEGDFSDFEISKICKDI